MNSHCRNLALVIFLLMLAGNVMAHGNLIRGTVVDSLSQQFLTGASVTLNENVAQTFTDQLGNFKFDNLEDGSYQLKVTFIGYKTYTMLVTVDY